MLKALKGNEKGLTLIELLAVLVIVGIIAAIAIPAIGGTINSAKTKSDVATKTMIEEAALRYMTDKVDTDDTEVTVLVADLVTQGYLTSTPKWNGTASTVTTCTVTVSSSAVSCTGTVPSPSPSSAN